MVHYSQTLEIMIKAPVIFHQQAKLVFPGVSEGGMTEIVGKSDRFHEIGVQP